jgi:L-iditol 2-dehydrogenase
MKASRLICPDIRKIEVEEFDIDIIPDDGFLVQNEYTAVSVGTEIYRWVHGGPAGEKAQFPQILGYCNAGTVLEVGKGVKTVKPGDRIAGEGYHASHSVFTGEEGIYQKVPDRTPLKAAAFMVMGAIAIHGVRVARIELGESVAVLGLGVVGQLAATLAGLSGGTPVIGIDPVGFRLQKAKDRGVDFCINPENAHNLPATVHDLCIEDGADVVIEATGIPEVYPGAVQLVCTAGRLIALGSPRGTVNMDFLTDVHLREVSISGAFQPATPKNNHIYYRWNKNRERGLVLSLMADGKLPIEDIITHTAKPAQCQEVFTMLADNPREALGVVFEWK